MNSFRNKETWNELTVENSKVFSVPQDIISLFPSQGKQTNKTLCYDTVLKQHLNSLAYINNLVSLATRQLMQLCLSQLSLILTGFLHTDCSLRWGSNVGKLQLANFNYIFSNYIFPCSSILFLHFLMQYQFLWKLQWQAREWSLMMSTSAAWNHCM